VGVANKRPFRAEPGRAVRDRPGPADGAGSRPNEARCPILGQATLKASF
jgi:hypothetical protein